MSVTQIDMSDIVNAPEWVQEFTIYRGPGSWLNGVWQPGSAPVLGHGAVTVATPRDIDMIPEGDKVTGAMVFHSQQPIYGTHADADGNGASSDIIIWRNHRYRVLQVGPFEDYGYFRAIATRMKSS
jgi:hypothetical protein